MPCSRMAFHGHLIDVTLGPKESTGLVWYVHPCFQTFYQSLSRVDRFLLLVLFALGESSMVSF
jgi:hypothetical protein